MGSEMCIRDRVQTVWRNHHTIRRVRIHPEPGRLSVKHDRDRIKNERKAQVNSPVTERERTQLRALLGGLQWLVTQTRVDGSIDVNLLQSCVATATVETLLPAILDQEKQGDPHLRIVDNTASCTSYRWPDLRVPVQRRSSPSWRWPGSSWTVQLWLPHHSRGSSSDQSLLAGTSQ